MKITALKRLKGPGRRLEVEVDGEARLTLSEEVAAREGVREGAEIDERRVLELEALEGRWQVRESALRLLSHRPRTERELRQRLARKGYPEEVVETCLDEMRGLGFLNDGAFARGFVRDRVRLRPKGPGLLADELRARGLDPATAEEAVSEIMIEEETTELDLGRAALRRWSPRPGEDPVRARRRLYGFLARRGFSPETIRELAGERLGPS
jgi:regulatory protein